MGSLAVDTNKVVTEDKQMEKLESVKLYREEVTARGARKIEVVVEEAKKKKKERPGSAASIISMEDIERRQQAAEERRKTKEALHLAQLAEKNKRAEDVRIRKALLGESQQNNG